MRYLPILLISLALFCQCKTPTETGPVQYEYLLMERQGGGQLDFRIYPGESRSNLNVYVSSSDFQPIDKRFQLKIDQKNVDAFDDFYRTLSGQMEVKGKLAKEGKFKGSWLSIKLVRGNRSTEITNPDLIQQFSLFEDMVRKQLGK